MPFELEFERKMACFHNGGGASEKVRKPSFVRENLNNSEKKAGHMAEAQ